MESEILHGDCFEILPTLPDKSFFSIITDPPYGINLDAWDNAVDVANFTHHAARITTGFYSFFGQMPTMMEWITSAQKFMEYREHISWVKRGAMMQHGLNRQHESILIYRHKNTKYYQTTGKYEDVKVPGVLFDVMSIEGIQRHISDLNLAIKRGEPRKSVVSYKGQSAFRREYVVQQALAGIKQIRSAHQGITNFTNVWSFLPPGKANPGKVKYKHPTQKPLELIKRLVELTTPPDGIVLDPFAGSGTTAIACLETGRRYVCIEKNDEYYEMILNRVNDWHKEARIQQQELSI
jgi:site-specific DNA-methyltransferase (adenine-specific)